MYNIRLITLELVCQQFARWGSTHMLRRIGQVLEEHWYVAQDTNIAVGHK